VGPVWLWVLGGGGGGGGGWGGAVVDGAVGVVDDGGV